LLADREKPPSVRCTVVSRMLRDSSSGAATLAKPSEKRLCVGEVRVCRLHNGVPVRRADPVELAGTVAVGTVLQ
jgi:hypothetical protein